MVCLWSGTVASLKALSKSGSLVERLSNEFKTTYGQPSEAEVNSWEKSLSVLLQKLDDPVFDKIQTVLELQMPVGAERADAVLLGGIQESPKGYILEFKQWSTADVDPETYEVVVPGLGRHRHPSIQVCNYLGKLRYFNSHASKYDLKRAVFLHNMDSSTKSKLLQDLPTEVIGKAPLFSKDEDQVLVNELRAHLLPAQLNNDEHALLCESESAQTLQLFDAIKRHGNDIANRVETVVASSGIGLTEEQALLVEEILIASRRGESGAYIVKGGPGSGKTLVAVNLLLRAMKQGLETILAVRNNRLHAILERCFDASVPGASGLIWYFEPKQGKGVGDPNQPGKFDLVICDEAQRMEPRIMRTMLSRSPVTAIFLDETQRLNPPEQGTEKAFGEASLTLDKPRQIRRLKVSMRCRGGDAYLSWIERFLAIPNSVRELPSEQSDWRKKYQFQICDSIQDFRQKLSQLRDSGSKHRVAMVASFTESPGSQGKTTDPENMRIGYPLTSEWDFYKDSDLAIRWLMRKAEYVAFWMNGRSSNLDRVASIYGTQGFESDFVGVVWGRDLVIRDGNWVLGDPNVCYDSTDGLVYGKKTHRWATEALDLIKNRYRIFLTRGIEGTLLFFEDNRTREFLSQ